jgi:hypothetical protein
VSGRLPVPRKASSLIKGVLYAAEFGKVDIKKYVK